MEAVRPPLVSISPTAFPAFPAFVVACSLAFLAAACSPSAETGSAGVANGATSSATTLVEAGGASTEASRPASTVDSTEPAPQSSPTTAADPLDPAAVVIRPEGLDENFIDLIRSIDGVERLAVLRSGQVRMTASEDRSGQPVDRLTDGFVIQLDARSYDDPASVEPFSAELAAALARLPADELILSRSSADLRRLDVGGIIEFDNGARFRVGAVLPDSVVGGAEVVLAGVDSLELAGGRSAERGVALVGFAGTGTELEAVLLEVNGGEGIRVFGGRGGDDELDRQRSTLSQIEVKQTFGEFAFRPSGSSIEIDPDWIEANLVTVDLPLLGPVRCHRVFAETLDAVMQGLVADGLDDVIDRDAFQGCWNPRTIAGSDRLSKHAWGIAADINFGNPLDDGPGSPVHPELLERMDEAGFTSGHRWTTPDPGHFEYRRPPLGDG